MSLHLDNKKTSFIEEKQNKSYNDNRRREKYGTF